MALEDFKVPRFFNLRLRGDVVGDASQLYSKDPRHINTTPYHAYLCIIIARTRV